MPRVRLVKDIYPYAKEVDPDTALTRTGINRLVNEGKIPCHHIGNKRVVNLDLFDRFLNGEDVSIAAISKEIEQIRTGIQAIKL